MRPQSRRFGYRSCADAAALAFVSEHFLCFESGYGPVRLPKLHIVAIDESPGGLDGGFIISTIQLNHANGSVV